jgi:hypothetical protein
MKKRFVDKLTRVFAVALIVGAGSCIDLHLGPPPAATLAVCPSSQDQSASSGLLDPLLGGSVSIGGTSVLIPVGALLSAQTINLDIPASQYMEIEVTANTPTGHLVFQQPITITIDYSRCSPDIQAKTLSVWNIDPNSHQLLQNLGGIDNKLTHQITITPNHISGYAIAF